MNQLKWTLFAAYAFGCVALYPQLPEVIPYHFNFSGEPNAWGGKFLAWFGLPLIALLMILLLSGIMKLTPRAPNLLNVPEKKRFLALSEEQRKPIFREVRMLMEATAIGTVLLLASIQYGMYAVATGRMQTLPDIVDYATAAFVLGVLVGAFALNARIKRIILGATDQP